MSPYDNSIYAFHSESQLDCMCHDHQNLSYNSLRGALRSTNIIDYKPSTQCKVCMLHVGLVNDDTSYATYETSFIAMGAFTVGVLLFGHKT